MLHALVDMSGLVCDVCGSWRMEEDDTGQMACLDCGTQSQQLFAETNEADDMGNHGARTMRTLRIPKVMHVYAMVDEVLRFVLELGCALGVMRECRGRSSRRESISPA